MKNPIGFLTVALTLVSGAAFAASPVAQTAGNNLTAYNPSGGSINNNNWNSMMNGRTGAGAAPTADFGNCNSLILRCASPKCANGGCVSVDIARPIVAGCVAANSACKQYGDALVDTLAAQLVANSVAKSNDAANAAAAAAAESAAQQSAQQIQQMQIQMQQMQSQMAAQNAETVAQLQAALDEQKQMAAQREAEAAAATAQLNQQNASGLTAAQEAAAANGISSDILVRNQISGQIMTEIENAEKQLNEMKAVMERAFQYAGCDASGNNCTGPARVKKFKDIASGFFTPYENTLDAVYDALVLAQTVGVDISDIYMMLNDSCNAWGQYLCGNGQTVYYTAATCPNGTSLSQKDTSVRGGQKCTVGDVIPLSDGGCQLVKILTDRDEIQRNWDWSADNTSGNRVEIGCASAALDNSTLFAGRRKKSNIDIEVLQRILSQDAPAISSGSAMRNKGVDDVIKYCVTGQTGFDKLQQAVATRRLPDVQICVNESTMKSEATTQTTEAMNSGEEMSTQNRINQCRSNTLSQLSTDSAFLKCMCNYESSVAQWDNIKNECVCTDTKYKKYDSENYVCVDEQNRSRYSKLSDLATSSDKELNCKVAGGEWINNTCSCGKIKDSTEKKACDTIAIELNGGGITITTPDLGKFILDIQ